MLNIREKELISELKYDFEPSHPLLRPEASKKDLEECKQKLESLKKLLPDKNDSGFLSEDRLRNIIRYVT